MHARTHPSINLHSPRPHPRKPVNPTLFSKIHHEASLQPTLTPKYRALVRKRQELANKPKRTLKRLDEDALGEAKVAQMASGFGSVHGGGGIESKGKGRFGSFVSVSWVILGFIYVYIYRLSFLFCFGGLPRLFCEEWRPVIQPRSSSLCLSVPTSIPISLLMADSFSFFLSFFPFPCLPTHPHTRRNRHLETDPSVFLEPNFSMPSLPASPPTLTGRSKRSKKRRTNRNIGSKRSLLM